MRFEWDAKKAAQNVVKHGVPFDYAARVFLDPHRLDSADTRRDYQEGERSAFVQGSVPFAPCAAM